MYVYGIIFRYIVVQTEWIFGKIMWNHKQRLSSPKQKKQKQIRAHIPHGIFSSSPHTYGSYRYYKVTGFSKRKLMELEAKHKSMTFLLKFYTMLRIGMFQENWIQQSLVLAYFPIKGSIPTQVCFTCFQPTYSFSLLYWANIQDPIYGNHGRE